MTHERATASQRVLILTPTGRDAALTAQVLHEGGIVSLVSPDAECVTQAAAEGAGCLLVAEEALGSLALGTISTALSTQPAWSDLPVLVLTMYGADSTTVTRALHA